MSCLYKAAIFAKGYSQGFTINVWTAQLMFESLTYYWLTLALRMERLAASLVKRAINYAFVSRSIPGVHAFSKQG